MCKHDKYDAWMDTLRYAPRFELKCAPVTAEIVKAQNEVYRKLMAPDYAKAFTPERILRHGIATIVFWKDGTKTVVKRRKDEPDNEYAAFTAALSVKIFGSNSQIKSVLRHKTEEPKEKKKENAAKKWEFHEGDMVRYTLRSPYDKGWAERYYPPIGTTGRVERICDDGDVLVHWPEGATADDGRWYCSGESLEALEVVE